MAVFDLVHVAFVKDENLLFPFREFAIVQRSFRVGKTGKFTFQVNDLVVNVKPLLLEKYFMFGLASIVSTVFVAAVTCHNHKDTVVV